VNVELERIGKEAVLSLQFSGQSKGNDEKLVRISGVPSEIRTEHLSNVSIQRYRYTRNVVRR
jgi:hypothetical protein